MRHLATALLLLLTGLAAAPAQAAPVRYALEADRSTVAFHWDFGKDELQGRMPVARADLSIDLARLENSTVDVAVDVTGAEAGFPFASQAMKGPRVLHAKKFPQITFVSNAVRRDGDGALIDGDITIRGVTRPMRFQAQLYRQRETEAGDLSRLSILLTGAVLRSEFGADGWADLVGDEVRLQILARIRQTDAP